MDTMLLNARRSGKQIIAEMMKGLALEQGHTVIEYSPNGVTKYKRHKHLTCIEVLKSVKKVTP